MDRRIVIGILTSSRADYGIYLPLLNALRDEPSIELRVLAFGTHLSDIFGKTVKNIEADNFKIFGIVETLPDGDSPADIAESMAKTINGFANIWEESHFDLVFALGDRYEMFAAVSSLVPFNIPVAHIAGGETTLGAIDNAFRHAITCMSAYHFTSTEIYKKRVLEITGKDGKVYNTGSLSIDSIKQTELLSIDDFKDKFNIDLNIPTLLITFHPETINPERNIGYISELLKALDSMPEYQMVFTMPNADTEGLKIRSEIIRWGDAKNNVYMVESFGSKGYLSCMKHCKMMLGNTSSGFVEAAYFSKPVINLGNRQTGRIITQNIINVPIKAEEIIKSVRKTGDMGFLNIEPIYGTGEAARKIVRILKREFIEN